MSPNEVKTFLINNYKTKQHIELASIVGISIHRVRKMLYKLGLNNKIRKFSNQDINFLKSNFKVMGNKELGMSLNRSADSIKDKLKRLKLKRTTNEVTALLKRPNKAHFKVGSKPHNTKAVQFISLKKCLNGVFYYQIKLADNHWQLYHRYLWEKQYGKIKKDTIISFVDGNQMNCVLENLKCISKEENMLRNSIHKLPSEIIPSLVLVNKINKKLKTLENGTK